MSSWDPEETGDYWKITHGKLYYIKCYNCGGLLEEQEYDWQCSDCGFIEEPVEFELVEPNNDKR